MSCDGRAAKPDCGRLAIRYRNDIRTSSTGSSLPGESFSAGRIIGSCRNLHKIGKTSVAATARGMQKVNVTDGTFGRDGGLQG
jgi:hypothetical protein